MGNRQRKILRAEHQAPINFTCGVCRRVHPYLDEDMMCQDVVTLEEIKDGELQEV